MQRAVNNISESYTNSTTATTMANDIGFDIIKKTGVDKPFKIHALTDNNAVITVREYSPIAVINSVKWFFKTKKLQQKKKFFSYR